MHEKASTPEPEKGSIKVTCVTVGKGAAKGEIGNAGGDAFAHLGHFRSPKVLQRGHNQGAPGMTLEDPGMPSVAGGGPSQPSPAVSVPTVETGGGFATPASAAQPTMESPGFATPAGAGGRVAPVFDRAANPIASARQENRAARRNARMGGGDMTIVRQQNRANLAGAKLARKERNALGFRKSDTAALRQSRSTARQENRAAAQANSDAARANLQGAVGRVTEARGALRDAVRGRRRARRDV